jgi:hypothetical protein
MEPFVLLLEDVLGVLVAGQEQQQNVQNVDDDHDCAHTASGSLYMKWGIRGVKSSFPVFSLTLLSPLHMAGHALTAESVAAEPSPMRIDRATVRASTAKERKLRIIISGCTWGQTVVLMTKMTSSTTWQENHVVRESEG